MASYLVSDSENSDPGTSQRRGMWIANIRKNGLVCTDGPLQQGGNLCLLQSVLCFFSSVAGGGVKRDCSVKSMSAN